MDDDADRVMIPDRYDPMPLQPLTLTERMFCGLCIPHVEDRLLQPFAAFPGGWRQDLTPDLVHSWYLFKTGKWPRCVFNYILGYVSDMYQLPDCVKRAKVFTMCELIWLRAQGGLSFEGPFFNPVRQIPS